MSETLGDAWGAQVRSSSTPPRPCPGSRGSPCLFGRTALQRYEAPAFQVAWSSGAIRQHLDDQARMAGIRRIDRCAGAAKSGCRNLAIGGGRDLGQEVMHLPALCGRQIVRSFEGCTHGYLHYCRWQFTTEGEIGNALPCASCRARLPDRPGGIVHSAAPPRRRETDEPSSMHHSGSIPILFLQQWAGQRMLAESTAVTGLWDAIPGRRLRRARLQGALVREVRTFGLDNGARTGSGVWPKSPTVTC
jgi:hypothetical protein